MTSYGSDLKGASGGGDLDDTPTAEYNYDLASDGGDLDDAPTAEYNYDREDVTRAQTTLSSATDRESDTSSADCESDTSAADRESDTCLPPWILLDPVSYIDEDLSYDNATTTKAQTVSWREDGVKVSFFVANPPCPSHFSIHVPSIIEKPYLLCGRPTIVCTVGNLAVISVTFDGYRSETEYYLYRVVGPGRRPSLIHLDYISQQLKRVIHVVKVGLLLSEGDGGLTEGGFVLAALALEEAKREQYSMHVFWLEHGTWINKVERLERHQIGSIRLYNIEKVIVLSDRELGFVDLWNGILVFDVLHENLTPRYIPLPTLLPGNQSNDQLGLSGKHFRDVIFSTHSLLKCLEVEMSWKHTVHCSTESEEKDIWDSEILSDAELMQQHQILDTENGVEETYEYIGWRLICWSRKNSSDGWRKDCSIRAKDMIAESQICDFFVSFPTLSMDGNEVYVVSKVHTGDLESHVIVVDLEKKSLKKFSLFPTKRRDLFQQAYIASDLFKYMNKPADGSQAYGQNDLFLRIFLLEHGNILSVRTSQFVKKPSEGAPVGLQLILLDDEAQPKMVKCEMDRPSYKADWTFWE